MECIQNVAMYIPVKYLPYELVLRVVLDKLLSVSRRCYRLLVRAHNVRKGHTFSLLDKSMKFGTDDLHAILFQKFDGSNLRF